MLISQRTTRALRRVGARVETSNNGTITIMINEQIITITPEGKVKVSKKKATPCSPAKIENGAD